ncbi:MAG TPA: glycosyltransferase family 39 protein [Candidatus Dormibacteraeota bacterium]|nr:glycosyltransferase family 39 protein [Candidatus Dormibacteraeota bacterium]
MARGLWTGATATGALVAAIAVAAAVRLTAALGPVHDYDEGVYWESLRQLDRGARLYGDVYSSQPPLFLLGVRPIYDLLGQGLTGGRLAVVVLSVAGVAAGGLAMRRIAGARAAAFAVLLLGLDPLLVVSGSSLMADAPAVSLALLAVWAATRVQPWTPGERRAGRSPAWGWAALSGALAAAAALTKLSAVSVIVPVAILAASLPGEDPAPGGRRWTRRASPLLAAGAGFVAATAVVLVPLGGDLGAAVTQSVGLHLSSRSVDEGGLREALPDIVRELPLALLAVAGMLALARRRGAVAAALGGWILSACAALVATHPLWVHHLVVVVAPAGLLAGAGCDALVARLRTAGLAAAMTVACAATGTAAVAGAVRVTVAQTASEGTVARLQAALPTGAVVVTDDQAAAARAALDTPPRLVDTSLVRILSGDLTAEAVEDLVSIDDPDGVYLGTSRLDRLDGFVAWVQARYPRALDLGEGTLYLPAAPRVPPPVTPQPDRPR